MLAESEAQWDGVTEYRFSRDAFWGWVLWKRSPGGAWRRLYGFTEEPQLDIDFIMPSLFCDVHPMSPFQQNGAGLYFFTGCSFVTARQQADMVS